MAGFLSRHLKKPLLASFFALSIGTAASPAHAFLDSEKAWNDLLQFAVRQINAPGEFEIELGKVTKPEDGFALISTLKVKDADGVWLDASGLLVDWNPTSLLRGRFSFETLSADDVKVLRAPIGRGDPPGEEAQIDFAWPRPPVTMVVETLLIKRIEIAEGLLPQDITAKVEGRFLDKDDIQEATLGVTRLDRPGDSINLGTRIDFDDLDISFSLEAAEAPGGLVAELAGLPETEALEITAAASGNPDALPFTVYADIGQIGVADGEGVARWNEKIAVTFDGEISPGEETSGQWRTALGDAAKIKLDAEQTDAGAYLLNTFQIDSEAFRFMGDGTVDPEANTIDLDFDWTASNIDALNAVMAPSKVSALSGTATAVGALNAPKVDVNAVVRDLTAGFGSVDAMDLVIDSKPQAASDSQTQRFSFIAKADGLVLNDDALQEALGETPTFRGNGAFFGAENRIAVERINIEAASLDLDGNADFDLTKGSLDAELSGAARQLGPFLRAAGLPVDGVAELAMKIQGLSGTSVERMFLNAQLSQLTSEDPNTAAIIGETAVLEALLVESDPGVVDVERGFFESATLRTEAKGQFSIPADTVNLTVDWRLKDAARIAPVIAPAKLGAAEGDAILKGTLSEPKIDLTAVAADIDFEGYGADRAEVTSSLQMRKDLRAPFSMTSSVEGFRAPDPALAALVGSNPKISATGLYDTATSLMTLSESQAAIDAGDFTLQGDVHLRKRTLDASYTLVSRDLETLGAAANVEMSGKIDAKGSAVGSFTAPIISTRADIRALKLYGYSVETMDLDLTTEPASNEGDVPFALDLVAVAPSLNDPDLDALIGNNPKISGKGSFNPEKMRASLTSFVAELDAINATAKGDVDVQNKTLDLNFDLDARDLSGLSGIIGKDVNGALKASGSASGAFTAPEVDIDLDGQDLRFDQYSVGSIKGRVDMQQALVGYAPFDIDVVAEDVDLGDPSLNALIGPRAEVTAKGEFNQLAKALQLDSAEFDLAAAKGTASGSIDLSNQLVDMIYDVDVSNLEPIGGVANLDVAGSVIAKGSAKGRFSAPQIDTTITGRNLRYEAYEITAIDGNVDIKQSPDGFAPFDVDVEASGVTLGDPELNALIGPRATVIAKGDFNQSTQALNLDSARFNIAAAEGTASGSIDLGNQLMDVIYDVDVRNLEPIGNVANADLAGSVIAKGSAKGSFKTPQIDAAIKGSDLRFDAYKVDAIYGKIDIRQSPDGSAPFDIDVTASGVDLGDPALNALIGPRAAIIAKGDFDQSTQALNLERARFDVAAAKGTASGSVDLDNQSLDLIYDVDASDLDSIGNVAGFELAGSLDAKGSAKGSFAELQVDTTIKGRELRYGTYEVVTIDGRINVEQSSDGFSPFDIDVEASGVDLGDPALDALIGPQASITAKGAFNQATKAVNLDSARFDLAAARGTASGSVDLSAQSIDATYDLDVSDLEAIGNVAGVDLGGSVAAKGSVRGNFTAPQVDTTLNGRDLRFEAYSVAKVDGEIDIQQSPSGFAPFDIDVVASGLDLGDPALSDLVGNTASIAAKGAFNQNEQKLRIASADVISNFATASARGTVNLAAQSLDLDYALDAKSLSALQPVLKKDVAGALTATGSVSGSFTSPALKTKLNGEGLRFDKYGVAAIDGTISFDSKRSGASPFDIDVRANGLDLGDPAFNGALGRTAIIAASGDFDQARQALSLDAARVITDAATIAASGDINLKDQTLDIAYDLDAKDLSPFSAIAGNELSGAVESNGRASGSFSAPQVNTKLNGQGLRYGPYSVAQINGRVDVAQRTNGPAPFEIDVTASGLDLGDPNLTAAVGNGASIVATGTFDQTAQVLNLASANAATDAASASASGTIDLKSQTVDVLYDVDARNLSAFAPIIGTDLSGAVKAKGRATGPFVTPMINTTLTGRSLQYGIYSVGSIDGTINIPRSAEGLAPFDVDVTASAISTGDPALDALVGDSALVRANGRIDQKAKFLELESAQISTRSLNAAAGGHIDLGTQTLDVLFSIKAADISPATALVGKALGGALEANGSARGSFAAPIINLDAVGTGLIFDTYSVGQLNLNLAMDGANGSVAPFTLTAQASSPRLGDPNIDALLGELVTVDARGTLDQSALFLRLDDATVRAATGAARVAGLIDLKGKQVDVGYSAHVPSLGQLQPILGQTISGDVRVDGRATGGFDDPHTDGILVGSGVVFQTYELSSVVASYNLRNLITGPRGTASVDAQTPFGPLAASSSFDLSGGALRIDQVSVNGLGINLDGQFEALPGGLYAGDARLDAADLGTLGQFIGQDIGGTANGTVSLNAQDGRQNIAVDLTGGNLRYAQIASFGSFSVKGIVNDALSPDPFIDGQAFAASGTASGFPIQQVTVTARGTLSALEASVDGNGGVTGSDKLQTSTLLNLVNFPRGAQVYNLAASYLGVQLASAAQFTLREVPGGGWRADGLDLRIDDGEIVGAAEYSPKGLLANLRVRNVPMKLAGLAGVDLIQSGRLFGDMNIDTRGAPRGDFNFNAKSIRLKGAQLDDPFDLDLMGTLDGQAMDVVAQIESGIINQPLRAVARIPLKQVPGIPVPLPDNFAPFSASVDWEGDVSEFWAFVPAPNHVLSGPVVIRGRAAGTLDAPQLEGGAILTGGRYQNIEFGTLLDQINATGDFTQDGRVVFELTATDSVTGTVAARGSYLVADGTIDAGIDLNQAALVRRDDATAVISGTATAKSEGNDIAVRGAFRTNYVELRLIGGFGGSVIVVDAIPVGETAPRFEPPSTSGPRQRISLDISLDFPQQVFVRGRGLDSEWGGSIRATGFASDPKVNGVIERRRGILDLLGRQFELAIGEVRFTGPLDPFIKVRLQRDSNDITGWLDITGPSSDIELEFGSIPALPPDEVLPRLLFGRSKQSLSGLEAAQLAAGVATLLSGKASALDNVRGALGVDVLRVEGGDGDGTSITTGKYLTEDIFVGAKQNLETGGTSAFVEIEVFDNIELEGEFGADEAEGSASWKLDY